MKKSQKILLSIPLIIALFYTVVVQTYPGSFEWMFTESFDMHLQLQIIAILVYISITILIVRLWRLKSLSKDKRALWTFLLIVVVPQIIGLIYIWRMEDRFILEDKQTTPNKGI